MIGRRIAVVAGLAVTASSLVVALHAQAPPLFSARSDLVVLHVSVTDGDGRYAPGLTRGAFTVFEDGVAQPVTLFGAEDTPATIGLLIDDSASMFGLRNQVTAAVASFAATSHRDDEIFALAFNDRVRSILPSASPFTSDPAVLRSGLEGALATRGRTALYDAVDDGLAYLARGMEPRKALVIVSDGGDNASVRTLAEMEQATAASNTVIYGVAVLDAGDPEAEPALLKRLSGASGGLAFVPRDSRGIASALDAIARDIRSSYTLGYAAPAGPPGVRHVRVAVTGGGGALRARTRPTYVAAK